MDIEKSPRASGAARILGVGRSTFYRLTKRQDFPESRKLSPRLVVYDRDELIAWRDAQTVQTAQTERQRLGSIGRKGRAVQLSREARA